MSMGLRPREAGGGAGASWPITAFAPCWFHGFTRTGAGRPPASLCRCLFAWGPMLWPYQSLHCQPAAWSTVVTHTCCRKERMSGQVRGCDGGSLGR